MNDKNLHGHARPVALRIALCVALAACLLVPLALQMLAEPNANGADVASSERREEVLFWHFWGGAELDTVDDVVRRFNESQSEYRVRSIAMPGNNLDLKLFLSLAGGDPPDLVNIDDPVLADWALRGAIKPIDKVASTEELQRLRDWLYPAARKLTEYNGRLYGVCNGLDVRALYYNKSLLDEASLPVPETIDDLDQISAVLAAREPKRTDLSFLPSPRNLWAWGIVFGGEFFDASSGRVTLDSQPIVNAAEWMAGYAKKYGKLAASLRARDQSLPGKSFPLTSGRYALVVDGQWRVRDIENHESRARAAGMPDAFGVCSLPAGPNTNAGWINGNYFVVPEGSQSIEGAWAFMKFWCGFGHEQEAAKTCEAGGWIPVSPKVAEVESFRQYLKTHPLFAKFVELARSESQVPRPNVPGAARFDRELRAAAESIMNPDNQVPVRDVLSAAQKRIQEHLDAVARKGRDDKASEEIR